MSANVEYSFAPPRLASASRVPTEVTSETMAISIVIVTRNRREELRATLAGLAAMRDERWEVIVVANACTDGSEAAVAAEFPWVRLVGRRDNSGMPATNFGIALSAAPVVMVLDDDALPTPGTVEHALRRFEREPGLHALACAIVENGVVVNDNWAPRTLSFFGCGAFFRRETLAAVGGYSWDVPWLSNERELGCRLIGAGHHVTFDADCRVVHRRSPLNRSWPASAFFHARDSVYRVVRYYPWHLVPMALAFALGYNLLRTHRQDGVRPRDLVTLAEATAAGLRKGWRSQATIPLSRRLAAARIWRAEMARQKRIWRIIARLAPHDFWW
jgi:GT2 family glycosyltransferase